MREWNGKTFGDLNVHVKVDEETCEFVILEKMPGEDYSEVQRCSDVGLLKAYLADACKRGGGDLLAVSYSDLAKEIKRELES